MDRTVLDASYRSWLSAQPAPAPPSTIPPVTVGDDASDVPAARQLLQRRKRDRPLQCRVVEAESSRTQFNYARLMNDATRHVRTALMLHLNDDVEALEGGWLEQMAG